jgi:hypothetical protein
MGDRYNQGMGDYGPGDYEEYPPIQEMPTNSNYVYEQELKLEDIFQRLSNGFKLLDRLPDEGRKQALLKDLTSHMQEAKR